MTLFVGGQETTFSALTFIIYLLAKDERVQEKLYKEIIAYEAEAKALDGMIHLNYLNYVIHEGLRLFPPVWAIGRKAVSEDRISGVVISKGATMFISVYGLHRNPNFWESPLEFLPERFHNKIPNNIFMPFGKGPRACVGANFGFLEIQIILCLLIKNFKINLVRQEAIEVETLLTMLPKEDLWLYIVPR